MGNDGIGKVPEGLAFLVFETNWQNQCATATTKLLPQIGSKGPKLIEGIGTMLSILYRLATCHWDCKGDPHTFEYLIGRVVNECLAAWRLVQFGFYDEALILIRSAAEIANLLCLFLSRNDLLEKWKQADDKVRRHAFSAVKVRLELEKIGAPIPVSEDRYRKLSGFSTHVSPKQNPQRAFSEMNRAFIGGSVQIPGLLIVVNEIAHVLIPIGIFATRLLKPSQEVVEKLMTISKALNDNLGGIDILNLEDLGISKAPIEKA